MSVRTLVCAASVAAFAVVTACSSPTAPATGAATLKPAFQGGIGGGGGTGGGGTGGGGGTISTACVEDGTVTALSYLSSGPWIGVNAAGFQTNFTFTANGHWERTRTDATGHTIFMAKGDWVQPMLRIFVDVNPYLTGTATNLSHCQFSWPTAQEGTLVMTRQ